MIEDFMQIKEHILYYCSTGGPFLLYSHFRDTAICLQRCAFNDTDRLAVERVSVLL